jgi:hypothetical protein
MHEEAASIAKLRSGCPPHAPDMRKNCGTGGFRILTTFTTLMGRAGGDADGKFEIKAFQ